MTPTDWQRELIERWHEMARLYATDLTPEQMREAAEALLRDMQWHEMQSAMPKSAWVMG